jgi:hypothetical protein
MFSTPEPHKIYLEVKNRNALFCRVCVRHFTDLRDHFSAEEHTAATELAKGYLDHCGRARVSPVDCPPEDVLRFLRQLSSDDAKKIRNFLDRIHGRIGDLPLTAGREFDDVFGGNPDPENLEALSEQGSIL